MFLRLMHVFLNISISFYDREFLPFVPPGITSFANSFTPILQCTSHMCPVRIHWHVSKNYKDYWRVKLTVTNFNYWWKYTDWNLVVQHPNFDNLTKVYNFNHESLNPYGTISKFLFYF